MAPRRNDYDYGDELPISSGWGHFDPFPDWWLSKKEVKRIRREQRERAARKRPPGFAPWPEDEEVE